MKPLSRKIRILSGIFLGVLFVILTPLVLADSFGYHLGKLGDVLTIVKTGGIYVMSDVSGAEIYVDDEYYKDSGIFLKNTLIQGLTPNKTHKVVAHKDGRHDWVKELEVYESLVTEARLLMLEEDLESRTIYPFRDGDQVGTTTPPEESEPNDNFDEQFLIEGFVPTNPEYRLLVNLFSDQEENVYSTTTSLLSEDESTSARDDDSTDPNSDTPNSTMLDSATTSTSSTSTMDKREVPEYFERLGIEDPDELENLIIMSDQVAWLEDGNIVLNWVDEGNTPNYYYCLEIDSCREKIVLDWHDDIISFDFLPGRNDVFMVLVESGLYAVEIDDRSDRNIQPIYEGQDLDFRKDGNDAVFVKEENVFHEILF